MTQAVFYVGLDVNKDKYFSKGVSASDPLNLFLNPQQLEVVADSGATLAQFIDSRYTSDYNYLYICSTGVAPNGGIVIGGQAQNEQSIWVTAGQQITIRFRIQGSANYVGETVRWQVLSVSGAVHSATTDYALTGTLTAQSVTFTPDTDSVYLNIIRITTTTDVIFTVQDIMIVPGSSVPTNYNTGYASDAYESIGDYVISAQWNNGLDQTRQDIASGSRCTLVLDNREGYFDQDGEGAELVTNGSFTSWGTLPTGWTYSVAETPGSDEFTEVGFDSLYGGTGIDSCNYYNQFVQFARLYQTILTAGKAYRVSFDIGARASGGIRFYSGQNPISRKYSAVGHYEFTFTAPSTDFAISSDRATCNITFDNISVKEIPRYAGLAKGTLLSICGYEGSTEISLYIGRLMSVTPSGGTLETRIVTMEFSDIFEDLLSMDFFPNFTLINSPTYQSLVNVFTYLPTPWPYVSSYWLLGESILGVDTIPLDNINIFQVAAIDTENNTVLDRVGDIASNREKGIAVGSFVRDIMATEMGGRLWVDARTGYLRFRGRNADNTIITPTYTLTNDDFEPPSNMVYGDDILNKVAIFFKQRRDGISNQVLWKTEADIIVAAGATKRITGQFRDPTNELIRVSAFNTEPFAKGTDYVVSTPDPKRLVQVSVELGTQSATFTITNNTKSPATLTTLQLRGHPTFTVSEQSVSAQNGASIYRHNQYDQTHNLPLMSDPDDALALATGLVTLYSNPITRIVSITFQATNSDTRYSRALNIALGNRIRITQSFDNHDASYIVIGEQHNLVAGGEHTWQVTWILKPIDRVSYWYLGEAGRSELGITTVLAF